MLFDLQTPNVDQGIQMLAGGFGQRFIHFEYKYRNMTLGFSSYKLYGICIWWWSRLAIDYVEVVDIVDIFRQRVIKNWGYYLEFIHLLLS